MKTTDFAKYLTDFLGHYLPSECGMSPNTIKTYSYTFSLVLKYMEAEVGIKPEKLEVKDFTKHRVISFLEWLENKKKSKVVTRNARLATIRSFFKYLQYRDLSGLQRYQDIMSIRNKRGVTPDMAYIPIDGIRLLLKMPDIRSKTGMRDFVMISLLYDSGCRVQELIDLSTSDFQFGEFTTVRLCGKGNKTRYVPLNEDNVLNLRKYMKEHGLFEISNEMNPFFPNPQGEKLSRMTVLGIVKKYANMARNISPELIPAIIGCHTFRRSKAMHLLEADVHLFEIRDILGHKHVSTTEIYAKVSAKRKEEALAKLIPDVIPKGKTSWNKEKGVLAYLKSLQNR